MGQVNQMYQTKKKHGLASCALITTVAPWVNNVAVMWGDLDGTLEARLLIGGGLHPDGLSWYRVRLPSSAQSRPPRENGRGGGEGVLVHRLSQEDEARGGNIAAAVFTT